MNFRHIAILAVAVVVLALAYDFMKPQAPPEEADARPLLWSVHMDDLQSLAIFLPRAGKQEAWVKRPGPRWFFDRPDQAEVDVGRWGGGVPLLLSGPKAERRIAGDAAADSLVAYGFDTPAMVLGLVMEDGRQIDVEVGDRTPGGEAYYVRLAGEAAVYTVHEAWYGVLERLVLDPPVASKGTD